ncbi:MAG: septum formation inhibitor Maf [Flavobacteriales bacterium]
MSGIRSVALGIAVLASVLVISRSFRNSSVSANEEFNKTWKQNKAELTTYELTQARYGELHTGIATLIFVTEEHDSRRQVKIDSPGDTLGKSPATMLKCNMVKNFTTGMYPYSMMTSVFTPLDSGARYHKITCSSQEWCGHTYAQINCKGSLMHLRSYSYFEEEGDSDTSFYNTQLLEDAIWNLMRLHPDQLPLGEHFMFPSIMYCRLAHISIQAYRVNALLKKEKKQSVYKLEYPQLQRSITIWFNTAYPHEIEKWEETYRDGFGNNSKVLTTTAVRKKRIWTDYWNKHTTKDKKMRQQLGLE